MNYIDIIIIVPLVWGLYKGFSKGLILEAASFIAFGAAVYFAINFSEKVGDKLSDWFNLHAEYLPIIAFVCTFLGVVIIVFTIAKLIHKLAHGMALGGINKIGGAAFGSLKYALVMSVVIFVIDSVEKSYPEINFERKNGSILYEPIGTIAPVLIPGLRNATFKGAEKQINLQTVKPSLNAQP